MDSADDLVINDPLIFCNFLEGELVQKVSGLDIILTFFSQSSVFAYDLEFYVLFSFMIMYIVCRFFSAGVYSVPIIFLLGIEFLQFVEISLVETSIWWEGVGKGLTLDSVDLSNVYCWVRSRIRSNLDS